jgi:diadenosine tetraphosphate (Ap4A) HIT family hydrolase
MHGFRDYAVKVQIRVGKEAYSDHFLSVNIMHVHLHIIPATAGIRELPLWINACL